MPVIVKLRHENGDAVGELSDPAGGWFSYSEVPSRLMHVLDSRGEQSPYRLLRYVDPYGDTIFNTNQAADLIADLDLALASAQDEEDRRHVARIRVLAEHLRDEMYLYLWFIGD